MQGVIHPVGTIQLAFFAIKLGNGKPFCLGRGRFEDVYGQSTRITEGSSFIAVRMVNCYQQPFSILLDGTHQGTGFGVYSGFAIAAKVFQSKY